ncbi:3,4-dihydroxy-2-butanone-4-phosphate synthase [Amycolatopsis echigonensis]|uniref:3,4-dihydroxy-2-butanone-4-phosphate synthase n=1 Tax=Amycolatopsis echigonensis TaxID=2576905 RepID=A0A8E2B8H9_9PSEU|nr:3,4-dihydroxy-2-butanone-4-phosphate synthase [Amycolatopsis echigonensis]MBB2502998.1 3,4-dihydroxy-2-butanone-4-phosphate synthase [Amycolatopsis echigonensis]
MALRTRAAAELADGRPVVLLDERGAAELVVAAALATRHSLAFLVRHGSGFVRVALTGHACDRLGLPPVIARGPYRCAQAVSVDAATGVSTGISAADRCRTVRLLADPAAGPGDLRRPGHLVPVRAWPTDGAADQPGASEAGIELARLAGLEPAAVLCGLVSRLDPASMAGPAEALDFAREHDLAAIAVAALYPLSAQERRAG